MRKFLNKYWGWTFLIVPIILQAVFFYFPMVQGAFYSLTNCLLLLPYGTRSIL